MHEYGQLAFARARVCFKTPFGSLSSLSSRFRTGLSFVNQGSVPMSCSFGRTAIYWLVELLDLFAAKHFPRPSSSIASQASKHLPLSMSAVQSAEPTGSAASLQESYKDVTEWYASRTTVNDASSFRVLAVSLLVLVSLSSS